MPLLLSLLAPPALACSPVDEPSVREVRPADGAVDVPLDARLVAVVGDTVSAPDGAFTFTLTGASGPIALDARSTNLPDGSFVPDRVVTLTPAAELVAGETYTLDVTPLYGSGTAVSSAFQVVDVHAIDAPAAPTLAAFAQGSYTAADDGECWPESWSYSVEVTAEAGSASLALVRLYAVDSETATPDTSVPLGAYEVPDGGGTFTVSFRTGDITCVAAVQEDHAGNTSEFSAVVCDTASGGEEEEEEEGEGDGEEIGLGCSAVGPQAAPVVGTLLGLLALTRRRTRR